VYTHTHTQIAASKAPCEARLPEVKAVGLPVLVLMGTEDPDFPKPEEEAKLIAEKTGGR
jgi:hypothetical protein